VLYFGGNRLGVQIQDQIFDYFAILRYGKSLLAGLREKVEAEFWVKFLVEVRLNSVFSWLDFR